MQLSFHNLCSRRVLLPALAVILSSHSNLVLADGGGVGQAIAGAIAGAAPAAAAAFQASADKDIAKINANAQIEMTQTQADTSKYQSDSTKEVSEYQAATAQVINKQNNDHQTDDLLSTLRYKAFDRELNMEEHEAKRRDDFALNEQRMALAYKQADAQFALAQATLQAQLTQAGLSTGFVTKSAGSNLNVSRVFGGQGNPGLMPGGGTLTAQNLGAGVPPRSRLLNRLPSPVEKQGRFAAAAGPRFAAMGNQLYGVFSGNLSQGSTRWSHRVSEESDLSNFQHSIRAGVELARHRPLAPEAPTTHTTHGAH